MERVKCKCGLCDMMINRFDNYGRERFFAKGHHSKYRKVLAGRGNKVKCACGLCDVMIQEYDNKGRKRMYEEHHYSYLRENKLIGEKTFNYKTGKWKYRGYVFVSCPEHPRARPDGYIQEHILVLENKLGRPLEKREHTHHINGIKDDNRPENLTVLDKSKHGSHHSIERWKRDKQKNLLNPPCPKCKNTDVRKEGFYYTKTEKKQKYFCVSCKKSFIGGWAKA